MVMVFRRAGSLACFASEQARLPALRKRQYAAPQDGIFTRPLRYSLAGATGVAAARRGRSDGRRDGAGPAGARRPAGGAASIPSPSRTSTVFRRWD